jgi:putative oxidoreductase
VLKDVTALIARIGVGVVFVAHGWQKISEWGLAGTAASFEKMGVPMPTLSAWFAALVEFGGGLALIAGVALPIVGALLAANMAGALFIVHLPNGLTGEGGYELVLALGLAALALGFNGGAYALDRVLFKKKAAVPA